MMPQSTLILFLTVSEADSIDSGSKREGVVVCSFNGNQRNFRAKRNLVLVRTSPEPEPDHPEPEPMCPVLVQQIT